MSKTFLIIDGYNVLHTCGLLPRNTGGGVLEKARTRFLALLNKHLAQDQRLRTTIVFDSQFSGMTAQSTEFDMLIEFAVDHPSADERIIQLIRQHSAPKQLVVVSSDHEIQRAAKVRRSITIDSDAWLDGLLTESERASHSETTSDRSGRGDPSLRAKKIEYWLEAMELSDLDMNDLSKPANPGRHEPVAKTTLPDKDEFFPPDIMDELDELLGNDQDAP